MLTGYEIDVYRDTEMIYEDDIYLDDFADESTDGLSTPSRMPDA